MAHSGQKAICCGEGGAALFVSPATAGKWKDIRAGEINGGKVISYCAGCSTTFGNSFANTHLLDLIFFPEQSIKGREKVSKAPFTYISRLLLKKRLLAANSKDRNTNTKVGSAFMLRICQLVGLVLSILTRFRQS